MTGKADCLKELNVSEDAHAPYGTLIVLGKPISTNVLKLCKFNQVS